MLYVLEESALEQLKVITVVYETEWNQEVLCVLNKPLRLNNISAKLQGYSNGHGLPFLKKMNTSLTGSVRKTSV